MIEGINGAHHQPSLASIFHALLHSGTEDINLMRHLPESKVLEGELFL
jgi:hypothetical protein